MYISIKVWQDDHSGDLVEGCGCSRCYEKETSLIEDFFERINYRIRFACELCGNKRCPHNADHRNACSNSNEPGQAGSDYV